MANCCPINGHACAWGVRQKAKRKESKENNKNMKHNRIKETGKIRKKNKNANHQTDYTASYP